MLHNRQISLDCLGAMEACIDETNPITAIALGEKISERLGRVVMKSTLSGVVRLAKQLSLIRPLFSGVYVRGQKITPDHWRSLVDEFFSERAKRNHGNRRIDVCTDAISLEVVKVLQKYSPMQLSTSTMLLEIPDALSVQNLQNRLRIMRDRKLIYSVGSGNKTAYCLPSDYDENVKGELGAVQNIVLEFRELQKKNSILLGAFISISRKLEEGEDIKQVMIDTGKLIEEMV